MKRGFLRLCVLGMILVTLGAAAADAAAAANKVVVQPGNMNGWKLGFQANSYDVNPIGEFLKEVPGAPEGTGAFHMQTLSPTNPPGYLTDPLQKVYLGTNALSGVALNEITSFKLYTFLAARDYAFQGVVTEPGGQPPIVEIITNSADSAQQRRFHYRPYGWNAQYHVELGVWQEWDLMASDGHPHWELSYQGSTNCWGDWNWVKSRYVGTNPMKFATPVVGDLTDGWNDEWKLANQSGTSISIVCGGGKSQFKIYNPEAGAWVPGWKWWREGSGINAYADKLVIGVNGVETIYDFEGGIVVGMSNRDATSGLMASGAADPGIRVVLWGRVLDSPAPTATEFHIDDGSGVTIKVVAPNNAQAGEYWRAEGTLDTSVSPAALTCGAGGVSKLN